MKLFKKLIKFGIDQLSKLHQRFINKLDPLIYEDHYFINPIEIKKSKSWIAIGQFISGTTILNGIGMIVYKIGSIKEGRWINDKLEGKGIHIMSNGNYYEGNFKNGKYHGIGTRTNKSIVYKWIWENGNIEKNNFKKLNLEEAQTKNAEEERNKRIKENEKIRFNNKNIKMLLL